MKKRRVILYLSLVLVLLAGFIAASAAEASFSDVKTSDWHYETVTRLVQRGGIKGYPDGSFKPNDSMKKGEFVKLIVGSLGFEEENASGSHWAMNFINKAEDLDILDQSEFRENSLNKEITRNEMAKIAVRTLEYLDEKTYPDNIDEYESLITDYKNVDSDYNEYVLKSYVKGIITGYEDGSFKGERSLNRAEAATVAMRLFDKSLRKEAKLEEKPEITPEAGYNVYGAIILETDGIKMKIIDGLGRERWSEEATVEVVEELTRTENMTLRWDDPYRPMAIPGDTFITEDGREIVLEIDEETGVLGFGQNVATELGRYYPGATKDVPIVEGSQGYRMYDRTAGSPYYVDEDTGRGYYRNEWLYLSSVYSNSRMKEIYFPDAKNGDTYRDIVEFDGYNWYWIGE